MSIQEKLQQSFKLSSSTMAKALDTGSVTIWNPSEQPQDLQIANPGNVIEISWGHKHNSSFGAGFIGIIEQTAT